MNPADLPDPGLPTEWKLRPEVLLCANTVKPMHELTPRTILGSEWWDRERQKACMATSDHCIACGVYRREAKEFQRLEGHEIYRIDYAKGRQVYTETVPLCHYCHCFIHDGRLRILLLRREVGREKFDAVMEHGRAVLAAVGVTKKLSLPKYIAPWSEWRLVLFGKLYPPKYKSYEEWSKHFNPAREEQ